jgi:Fe-Mn family superoxide dismutase
MSIELPKLPWDMGALAPHISNETIEYHYGKHHKAYVDKLNAAIGGGKYEKMSLDDMVRESRGEPKVFNNAAQTWNHTFYWHCMSPNGGGEPKGAMADAIKKSFGSFEKFKEEFSDKSATLFGSGWAWVVKEGDKLSVLQTKDADNPMTQGKKPVLTCDVWEHAYYIDYRNARPKYVEAFWNVINWEFMEKNL